MRAVVAARRHWVHVLVIFASLTIAFWLGAGSVRGGPAEFEPFRVAPDGVAEDRDDSGLLVSRGMTLKGMLHGHFEQWHDGGGRLAVSGQYRFGTMDGEWEWFDPTGKSIGVRVFRKGQVWATTQKK